MNQLISISVIVFIYLTSSTFLQAQDLFFPDEFTSSLKNEEKLKEKGLTKDATTGSSYKNISFKDSGIEITTGSHLSFPTENHLNALKGKITFQFKPNWDGNNDPRTRYLLNAGPFKILKFHGSSKDYFVFRFDDNANNQKEVSSINLATDVISTWQANTWHTIEVTWDLSLEANKQYLSFLIDNTHTKKYLSTWNGIKTLSSEWNLGTNNDFNFSADGIFKNISISNNTTANATSSLSFHASLESDNSITEKNGTFTSTSFAQATTGKGILIDGNQNLKFPTAGIINKSQGTITFKFKPNWNGDIDSRNRYFLDAGEFRIFKWNNYIVFNIDKSANKGTSNALLSLHGIKSWKSGEWHTIIIYWDFSDNTVDGYIGISIDGQMNRAKEIPWFNISDLQSTFHLGDSDIAGTHPADGTFDELKIYNKSLWDRKDPIASYKKLTTNNGVLENYENTEHTSIAPKLDNNIQPAKSILFFQKPAFSRTYENTIPHLNEIKETLTYQVAQGESETLFFNIYCRQTFQNATIHFTPFKNGTATLSNAKIKIIKNWWQSGTTQHRTVLPHYVPELLLSDDIHDDALILNDLNQIKASNWSAFNLPSFPVLPNIVTELKKYTSRQLAIIIEAPSNSTPGTYTSSIQIKNNTGTLLTSVVLKLEVLPFELQKTNRDFMIYHTARLKEFSPTDSFAVSFERYKKQIKDIANHGFNGLYIYGSDLETITKQVATIKENNITGKVITHRRTENVRDLLENNGFEPYFYGVDEPNSAVRVGGKASKIENQILQTTIVHNLGDQPGEQKGKMITAIRQEWSAKLDDPNDPIYSLPDIPPNTYEPLDYTNFSLEAAKDYVHEIVNGTQTTNKPTSYYWQILQELPATNRTRFGYFFWNTKLKGVFPYVYQHLIGNGNPYDDFDIWHAPVPRFRDHLVTYPSKEGPVSTMQWEAIREGIDDLRYLQTWSFHFDRLKALDISTANQSKNTIDILLSKYKDLGELNSRTPEEFSQDRKMLQSEITILIDTYKSLTNKTPLITNFSPEKNSTTELETSLTFNVTASDPDGNQITYQWFINNTLQDSQTNSFTHHFQKTNHQEIKVIIKDKYGASAEMLWIVDVKAKPIFTILANSSEHGTITPSGTSSVIKGDGLLFSFKAEEDYALGELIVDGINQPLADSYQFIDVNASHTIEAQFIKKSILIAHNINVTNSQGGSDDINGFAKIKHGSDLKINFTPTDGYQIKAILINGASQGAINSYHIKNIQSDVIIKATYEKIQYSLSIEVKGEGTATPSNQTKIFHGEDLTITLAPAKDYQIEKIILNGISQVISNTIELKSISKNTHIEITFTPSNNNNENEEVTPKTFSKFTFEDLTKFEITDGKLILFVKEDTDLTEVIVTFEANNQEVYINGILQQTSITKNDFTKPITYTILSSDGKTTTLPIIIKQVDENGNVIEEEIIEQTKTENASSGGCQYNKNSQPNSLWLLFLLLAAFFTKRKTIALFHLYRNFSHKVYSTK